MTERRAQGECLGMVEIEALAGGLGAREAAREHLDGCERCRGMLEEARANNAFLSGLGADLTGATAGVGGGGGGGGGSLFEEPPPDAVPGYDIEGEIHRGAQGVVFKAVQLRTQRVVALKMLLDASYSTPKQRMRLQREAEIAASLRHPNIVTVYDGFMLPGGRFVIAMEYIEGVPLDEEPAVKAPLRERLAMLAKVCDAVGYAHLRGVIHRDLKPGNILVDMAGEPHVVDFGIAKQMGNDGPLPTMTGEFAGTLAYASPEQVRGRPDEMDLRTDVYSMGVILYEAVTGRHPYPVDGSMYETIREILQTPPKLPREIDRTVDADLETILLRALEKEGARRYQSVGALAADLRHYLAGEPIAARRDSTMYVLRRLAARHKVGVAAGAAFALFVLVVAASMTYLYGVARDRAEQLDRTNVRQSIEYARVLAMNGDGVAAEDLAWREHFRAVDEQGEGAMSLKSPTLWALTDVYQKQPCEATWSLGEGEIFDAAMGPSGEVVALTERGIAWMTAAGGIGQRTAIEGGCAFGSISADGTRVLVGTSSGAVVVDSRTGRELTRLDVGTGAGREVVAGAFASSGGVCAIGLRNMSVLVFDAHTGVRRHELSGFAAPIDSLAFSPDGQLLAGVDRDTHEFLWDTGSGGEIQSVQSSSVAAQANAVEVYRKRMVPLPSTKGRWVMANGPGAILRDFTPKGGDNANAEMVQQTSLDAPEGAIKSMSLSPDSTLVAAGLDGLHKIYVWDSAKLKVRTRLSGHRSTVTSVRIGVGNRALVSGDAGGVVKLWDLERKWITACESLAKPIRSVYFADGEAVFGGSGGVVAAIAEQGKRAGALREIRGKIAMSPESFDPNPTAGLLVSCGANGAAAHLGADGRITYWARSISGAATEVEIKGIVGGIVGEVGAKEASASLMAAAMDVTGTRVAVVNEAGELRIAVMPSQPGAARLIACKVQGRVVAVAARAQGGFVAILPHGVVAVDADGNATKPVTMDGAALTSGAIQGELLAIGDQRGGVRVLDVGTFKTRVTLGKPGPAVVTVAFGPDGLVAAGGGQMIRLWETGVGVGAGVGVEVLTIDEPHLLVNAIALSGDGRRLAVAGSYYDASYAGVWDLTAQEALIAGNVEYQLGLRSVSPAAKARVKAWAAGILGKGVDLAPAN